VIVGVGGVVAVRVGAEAGVGLVSGGGGSSLLLQHFWFRRLDCSAHRARPVQLAFALFLCKPRLDARLVEFVAAAPHLVGGWPFQRPLLPQRCRRQLLQANGARISIHRSFVARHVA